MRTLTIDERHAVAGGDDEGNETACQTAVTAGSALTGMVFGPPAAAAAGVFAPVTIAVCEVATTAAGQAIASGIGGAAEGIDAFGNSLDGAITAFKRAQVGWLTVDGL